MHESEINWDTLERLRNRFLTKGSNPGVYWQSEDDLFHYHKTFAARIGWKWDSALEALKQTGFEPCSRTLFDWGCGSGIATLRAIDFFGENVFEKVILWDHSAIACRIAEIAIREAHPKLEVEIAGSGHDFAACLVLISHALNELGYEAQQTLAQQLRSAAQIIAVEPGDHSSSRKLIALREALAPHHAPLAPCTHCNACPMLSEENQRHWCHFFGKPPIEAFTDGFWSRFARTMEIDLRNLPYSFLALQQTSQSKVANGASRLIGRPRQFKGYTRLLSCDLSGLRELELQKRDDKQLWKTLKKGPTSSLFHWQEIEEDSNRLKAGKQIQTTP